MERALRQKLKVVRVLRGAALLLLALAVVATVRPAARGAATPNGQGLPVSTLAAQGMDAQLLRRGDAFVRAHLLEVTSFVVVRHGKRVFERCYAPRAPQTAGDVQSVTKSVISALVGIALARGDLKSLDQKLVDF